MGGVPLAALAIQPPPDPLRQIGQALAIKGAVQNQAYQAQAQPMELQRQQLANEQAQYQMGATKAINSAYHDALEQGADGTPTINTGKLSKSLSESNYGSEVTPIISAVTKMEESRATLQKTQQENQEAVRTHLGLIGNTIQKSNYDPNLADLLLEQAIRMPGAPQQEVQQLQGLRQQLQQNPQILKTIADNLVNTSSGAQKTIEGTQTAQARLTTAQTAQTKLQAEMNPQSTLYAPSQASVAMGTAPGAQQIQAGEASLAGRKAAAEAAARQPFELALAKAKQAITQGDPSAAAQLLVNGEATLSQLKARGVTPEFIQQTLNAANQLSGGKFNAQKAEADFHVAESPENVRFFGSSKSLTDPGGTLDQLAQVGKTIPQNQIPVFNKIEDWTKAATGSGPVAKYAATALGVADDYAKVMGGGQGSDTSRLQALKLISAGNSPEQRAAAIEGIRGAVNSQTSSRIGNNSVMQRMYGTSGGAATQQQQHVAGGSSQGLKEGQTGKGSDGKNYVVKGGIWVPAP